MVAQQTQHGIMGSSAYSGAVGYTGSGYSNIHSYENNATIYTSCMQNRMAEEIAYLHKQNFINMMEKGLPHNPVKMAPAGKVFLLGDNLSVSEINEMVSLGLSWSEYRSGVR